MAIGSVNTITDTDIGKIIQLSSANISKVIGMDLTSLILDEDCSSLTGWAVPYETVTVDPAGQYNFLTTPSILGEINRTLDSPPTTFTLEIKTKFDTLETNNDAFEWFPGMSVGYQAANWHFYIVFSSKGLFIADDFDYIKFTNVTVLCNASADWQTWRFQVDRSAGDANATVEVFLEGVSKGTADCVYMEAATEYSPDGYFNVLLNADDFYQTNTYQMHVDHIKIKEGLGAF